MDVTVKGRLVRDSYVKYTTNGKLVADTQIYIGATNEPIENGKFLKVIRWEDEKFGELKKGDNVSLEGYYKDNFWLDRNGLEYNESNFIVKSWNKTNLISRRLIVNEVYANKVNIELSKYLAEFGFAGGIKELLESTDAVVYGGAIRDIIAKQSIHDIDICCLSNSRNIIYDRLEAKGFKNTTPSTEIMESYLRDGILFCPISFENNGKTIQLIVPAIEDVTNMSEKNLYDEMLHFIEEVDIRACGNIFTSAGNLIELVSSAILDSEQHLIKVNDTGRWYHKDRIQSRIDKLVGRGWRVI